MQLILHIFFKTVPELYGITKGVTAVTVAKIVAANMASPVLVASLTGAAAVVGGTIAVKALLDKYGSAKVNK